jgi:hypothetical protein
MMAERHNWLPHQTDSLPVGYVEEITARMLAQGDIADEQERWQGMEEKVKELDPLTRGQEARRKGQEAKQRILKGDW